MSQSVHYPVVIFGGGTSGVAAGIQAARLGTKTLIIERSGWFGGMLTSAGVSATDGNHQLAGGIWKEFRDSLYFHYGGPKKVETGWVSNTLFEPWIGARIFDNMAAKTKLLTAADRSTWKTLTKINDIWHISYSQRDSMCYATADIIIDATETGEIVRYLGIPHAKGIDQSEDFPSMTNPIKSPIIQDMTYAVILEDHGPHSSHTIAKPKNYNPEIYRCACETADPTEKKSSLIDCAKMLSYAKLPNNRYLINWPNCGNDVYADYLDASQNLDSIWLKAIDATLGFVYFMQTELGFQHLCLDGSSAAGFLPISDDLIVPPVPMMPYIRESVRAKGEVMLTFPYLAKPFEQEYPLFRTGIAVGDYPIDHHHKKSPQKIDIDFFDYQCPSYNVPLGVFIPKGRRDILVAEKNISVSNIVNGTTRLQPVVLGLGQACGTLAHHMTSLKPGEPFPVRAIQSSLLSQKAYIMPYIDIPPSHPHFAAIQRIGATGIIKGQGIIYKWANQTWFYPDQIVSEYEFLSGLKSLYPVFDKVKNGSGAPLGADYLLYILSIIQPDINAQTIRQAYKSLLGKKLKKNHTFNRLETAVLVDHLINPFAIDVDINGLPLLRQ